MGRNLVREAVYKVSLLLGDTEPQFVDWSEHELVLWFNDAQRTLCKFLPAAGARMDSVKLVPGTRQSIRRIPANRILPGDGSAAVEVQGTVLNDILLNMGPTGTTPGQSIRLVPRRDLDAINPGWHVTPGDGSIAQFVFDPRFPTEFFVEPGVPSTPDVWVEIGYQAIPVEIPNTGVPGNELYLYGGPSTATLTLDDQYADDLISYVMARAWLKSPERAANGASYLQQFLSSINAQAKAMTGTNPNLKVLPLAAEPAAAAS